MFLGASEEGCEAGVSGATVEASTGRELRGSLNILKKCFSSTHRIGMSWKGPRELSDPILAVAQRDQAKLSHSYTSTGNPVRESLGEAV